MDQDSTGVLAWHWLPDDGRLRFPPHTKVEVGQTVRAEGPLDLCNNGCHASLRALDALQYARGSLLCRVRLSGEIVRGGDKLCARERTVIAMADATTVLHEFACWVAERALEHQRARGHEPDPRNWAAIGAKRDWLAGKITDRELAAARDAAWDAAWDAARDAARAAALDAARAAARAAAWAAAWDAARDAAWDEQNAELERRLYALLGMEMPS